MAKALIGAEIFEQLSRIDSTYQQATFTLQKFSTKYRKMAQDLLDEMSASHEEKNRRYEFFFCHCCLNKSQIGLQLFWSWKDTTAKWFIGLEFKSQKVDFQCKNDVQVKSYRPPGRLPFIPCGFFRCTCLFFRNFHENQIHNGEGGCNATNHRIM